MKQPESYVDMASNELSLAGLPGYERRLIARLCRRARGNPGWKEFEEYGYNGLMTLSMKHGVPGEGLMKTASSRVLDDLSARLRHAQGGPPHSEIRSRWEDIIFLGGVLRRWRLSGKLDVSKSTIDNQFDEGGKVARKDLLDLLNRMKLLADGGKISGPDYVALLECMEKIEARGFPPRKKPAGRAQPGRKRPKAGSPAGPPPPNPVCLYEAHFVGGPGDGISAFDDRPCYWVKLPDNSVYKAKKAGDQPVMEWVDEETRSIRLYFAGFAKVEKSE